MHNTTAQKQPIVEQAGSGLRMPEATARTIDRLSRGLPKDFTYRRIAKAVDSIRVEPGERTDISVISTADIDRDGEVVLPSGGDWSDYNRVVCFMHDYENLPVGSNWWIKPEGQTLIAKTHYAPKPPDWGDGPWMPSAILHLMQQPVPICTAKSIGAIPLTKRRATPDEIARNPKMKGVTVIDRWKGLEYSVAVIAINPKTEMQTVSKCVKQGLVTQQMADRICKSMQTLAYTNPNPQKVMADYAHIDFRAPLEVQKCHREGLERSAAGEDKGHATPELKAMARHMAGGGEASPDFIRKAVAYHEQNAHHLAAKPGTPAYCLALLNGGRAGREHYKSIAKAMSSADGSEGYAAPLTTTENVIKGLESRQAEIFDKAVDRAADRMLRVMAGA